MNISDVKNLDDVKAFFAKDRFATENGMEIVCGEAGHAVCRVKLTERHNNAMGFVMGGVSITLADFAYAVASNLQAPGTVSLSSNISYIGTVKGEYMIAEAKCIKRGRTTCLYNVNVTDELGNDVAFVTITGFTKSNQEVKHG